MNRDISIARTMVEKALLQTTPPNLDLDEWENKKISHFLEATNLQKAFLDRLAENKELSQGTRTNELRWYVSLQEALENPDLTGTEVIAIIADFLNLLSKVLADRWRGDYGSAGGPQEYQTGGEREEGRSGLGRQQGDAPPQRFGEPDLTRLFAPEKPLGGYTRVQVFYATDREPERDTPVHFTANRGKNEDLRYGACEVSIPKIHKTGNLESPSFMRLEFASDPAKHIVLQQTWIYSEATFVEEVAASVDKSSAKDAFVFVHGFNVSFEDAARRTGQFAFDLKFVGAPIFYSWPSDGKVQHYMHDEDVVNWCVPHFQRFLTLLQERSGAVRIHVIAHSMGNRIVCEAVKTLSFDPGSHLRLNHLVLAAPDIDAKTFLQLAASLQNVSDRITLYESSKDKALIASRKVHRNPRAGEPFLIVPGIDSIDASSIDTDFLGHSYFSEDYALLSDIHSMLFNDEPAETRVGLEALMHADGKYYAFKARD
jgi:esterase/lipase superfamily enzyme